MAWGKRRKGKQSAGRTTPVPPPKEGDEGATTTAAVPGDRETQTAEPTSEDNQNNEMSTTSAPTPDHKANDDDTIDPADTLVLTSEKRRGVYECDYCHSDISQLPRIRCAVCNDFDLCLDCFATTDHAAATAGFKAANSTASELASDGVTSTLVTGLSNPNHDDTHGYRVCDSTRYPIFGPSRNVIPLPSAIRGCSDNDRSENDTEEDSKQTSSSSCEYRLIVPDDPKVIWTAEEDLRLLDAIKTHGLGNWVDISDAVGGNGSVGKTPKRCMERYFDDFLGRYGHILPQYTIVDDNVNDEELLVPVAASAEGTSEGGGEEEMDDESVRSSTKRRQLSRLPSNVSTASGGGRQFRKRFKVVPTESLPGYKEQWSNPYLPPVEGVEMGQEVARDLSTKNELLFVKATATASSKEEADKIRKEWEDKAAKQRIGAPTVLPPRPEDSDSLAGAELVGFMPRRGDFDIEYENEAEQSLADMEFLVNDAEQEKQLKLQVLQIYYQKQNEREKRRQFILSRNLYDYRKYVKNEQDLPQDERDLRHRMRLFERFHTPEEHKEFIDDIIKAKRLRKEIAKLQMYRRIGIRSLAEAEKYELDKTRRQFHKVAQLEKEAAAKHAAAAAAAGVPVTPASISTVASALAASNMTASMGFSVAEAGESSLWKNYRISDRKARRSIKRTESGMSIDDKTTEEKNAAEKEDFEDEKTADAPKGGENTTETKEGNKATSDKVDVMEVDGQADSTRKENTDEDFDITTARGYDLLSRKEVELCLDLKVLPVQYLEIKKALIQESLTKGLLEKEGPGSGRGMVVKLDIQRRGEIVDFMLRAGWISSRLASVARTVTPPPPATNE